MKEYIEQNRERFLQELFTILRIPFGQCEAGAQG